MKENIFNEPKDKEEVLTWIGRNYPNKIIKIVEYGKAIPHRPYYQHVLVWIDSKNKVWKLTVY